MEGLCPRCLVLGLAPESIPSPDPDSESAPTTEPPTLGMRLGDYELVGEIARGGMGVVYKARQRRLNRFVAVKVAFGGWFAAPDFVRRFRTEAEAAATLDHPHIVPIFEIGESDGRPFFSMKLLEGGTLVDEARRRPYSPERAVRTLTRIARAVHYAHQRGVLHRDIKPNNILLDEAGQPHLTDFGLARLVEQDSHLTRTMAILGTPAYMAPEQARGETRSLTTAADVYGLGAVLYELLTGRPPFVGNTSLETVRLVLDQEPTRPSDLNPDVDRDLDTLCLKCLDKDPARRYGSAETFADDLDRWLRHEPITARPTSGPERVAKWIRRRPALAALALTALAAIVAIGVLTVVFNWRLGTARRQVADEADANRRTAVRLLVADATRATDDGDFFGALLPLTEALRRGSSDTILADLQRRRLATLLGQCPRLKHIWLHDAGLNHAVVSLDGKRLATASDDGSARVWDLESGVPSGPALVHTGRVLRVVFGPDDRSLATQDASGFARLWDFATGVALGSAMPHRVDLYQPIVFQPDGPRLATTGTDSPALWTIPPGPRPVVSLERAGIVQGLDFSHDGGLLVCGGLDGMARIWDARSHTWTPGEFRHPAAVRAAHFVDEDRQLLTIAADWRVRVWDTESGALLQTSEAARSDIMAWALSPDRRWFATGDADNSVRIWDATRLGSAVATPRHRGGVDALSFSPDGLRLASGSFDRTARLWSVATGDEIPPRFPHAAGVSAVRFEPDGVHLVTGSFLGDVRRWRLVPRGGARCIFRLPSVPVAAAFDGDGRRVHTVTDDGRVMTWNLDAPNVPVWSATTTGRVTAATFSRDRKRVALGTQEGEIVVFALGDAQERFRIAAHRAWVQFLRFDATGERLVSTSADFTARVWNATDGRPATPPLPHPDGVLSADFGPDGHRVVTSGIPGVIRIWDLATGRLERDLHPKETFVNVVEFRPDGRQMITAGWDHSNTPLAARALDPSTGDEGVPAMFHSDGVLCARYSVDGRFVVTGGEDSLARVWESGTGRPLTPTFPHRGYVVDVAFDEGSRLVATASNDDTARVWSVADGLPVTPPLRHEGAVRRVEFSHDGRWLMTASTDKTVRLWDLAPTDWSVEDLAALAELLSSHHLDPLGDRLPLTRESLAAHWKALSVRHPEYGRDP